MFISLYYPPDRENILFTRSKTFNVFSTYLKAVYHSKSVYRGNVTDMGKKASLKSTIVIVEAYSTMFSLEAVQQMD